MEVNKCIKEVPVLFGEADENALATGAIKVLLRQGFVFIGLKWTNNWPRSTISNQLLTSRCYFFKNPSGSEECFPWQLT